MSGLFEKPEGISWDSASVGLPPMPTVTGGEDSMSMTISAALPVLNAEMVASVTSLEAKEAMFASKVIDAQSSYQNTDDAGGQSVGDAGSQIGQLGQLAQQAAGAAGGAAGGGGGGGIFGQLMEQAMKAAQSAGGGERDGESAAANGQGADGQQGGGMAPAGQTGGGAGQGNGANSGATQKDEPTGGNAQAPQETEADERRSPTERAPLGEPPAAAAGPSERSHAAPVSPPVAANGGSRDVTRDL